MPVLGIVGLGYSSTGGEWSVSRIVPGDLEGDDFMVRAYALGILGGVGQSNDVVIQVR
jgi:hypothetical protein